MKLLKLMPVLLIFAFINTNAYAAQHCGEIKGNMHKSIVVIFYTFFWNFEMVLNLKLILSSSSIDTAFISVLGKIWISGEKLQNWKFVFEFQVELCPFFKILCENPNG